MIADIATVIWKEWKEIFLQRGNMRSGLLSLVVIVGIVGVFFPLQEGPRWLTNPTGLVTWSWLPLFLVMGVVADSFAGERERHTLETLLASRLPDRAILFGKISAAVLYGWGIVIVSLLLGAVTVNVSSPQAGLQFYTPQLVTLALLLSLLASTLMAAVGVLVSLHSSTTRQAYQKMSLAFMVLWFIPILAFQFMPAALRDSLLQRLQVLNGQQVVAWALVILVLANAVLIGIGMAQFKRARLILD
ncbi:MAG TPA: ABC transporter permease subunit [Anaerolineales bacterium]